MSVIFKDVSVGWRGRQVIHGVDFEARAGELTAIAGRNGAGKSTLLACLGGAKSDYSGSIVVGGHDLRGMRPRQRALAVASMGQNVARPHVTVRELASFGRTPHLSVGGRMSQSDRDAVTRALDTAGIADLADRFADTLSGGELRRAYFAMALAQDAPVMALDEPTTHLDASAQFELLELIRRQRDEGRTILVVLHELPEMLRCADRIVLLDDGGVAFNGSPAEFLAAGVDRKHFGVRVTGDASNGYAVLPIRQLTDM